MMELGEVVKNLSIFKNLKDLSNENRLNQSVIFVCEDFCLLDSLIQNLCMEMFAEREKIAANVHPDIYFYPQNGKKNILVEDVQNLIDQSLVRPIESNKKVFIIKADSSLSPAVQNKLLKTLEEPNQNVFYFLLSRDMNVFLPTVQSRALKIFVEKLNLKNFKDLGFTERDYMLCSGNLERKQTGKDNLKVFEKCEEVLKTLSSSENLLQCSRSILNKNEIEQIVESFKIIFSQMIECKLKGSDLFSDIYEKYSFEAIAGIIDKIDQVKQKIKFNCNSQAILDCLLLAILEEKAKWAKKI